MIELRQRSFLRRLGYLPRLWMRHYRILRPYYSRWGSFWQAGLLVLDYVKG